MVEEGIREAGGTPLEFNTVSISDRMSIGTEGKKSSLVSRETIADSAELVVRGHLLDGLVTIVGCDKTIRPWRWRWAARHPGPPALRRLDRGRHASAAAT